MVKGFILMLGVIGVCCLLFNDPEIGVLLALGIIIFASKGEK